MASHSPTAQATELHAASTAAKAADEAESHRTAVLVRLLVLVAGALFLSVLGACVAASLTQPFARALLVAALALPVVALIALIARGWAARWYALRHTVAEPRVPGAPRNRPRPGGPCPRCS